MVASIELQRGAALLMVLVVLIVVGLVAVTGAQDSQLQTKMSVNSRQYEKAFYNAETILAILEDSLKAKLEDGTWKVPQSFENNEVNGLYYPEAGRNAFDPLNAKAWLNQGKAITVDYATGTYLVEYLGRIGVPPINRQNAINDDRPAAFRITVRGEVKGLKAWAIVQSEVRFEAF